jgi:hypothetical protein
MVSGLIGNGFFENAGKLGVWGAPAKGGFDVLFPVGEQAVPQLTVSGQADSVQVGQK